MKPTDLRGILQYIPRFREKTFVIAADGAVVSHINFANLLLDDLVAALSPRWCEVETRFNARGGIAINIRAEHGSAPETTEG